MATKLATTSRDGTMATRLRGLARAVRRLRNDCRANAAVEFALMAPFLLGMLVPIADLGTYIYKSMQLQLAAQAGAEYAARHDWDPNGILSAMQTAAPSLSLSTSDATVPYNTDVLPGACFPSCAAHSTTYPGADGTASFNASNVQACGCVDSTTGAMTPMTCTNPRPMCTGGTQLQSGVYYTVGAQMRYKTISGLQYPFIANNTLMTAVATVRVQ